MRKAALLLCTATLALGACGEEEESEQPAPAPQSSGESGGGTKVSMKNLQFDPQSLTVKKGETVTWTNDESVGHDVTKEAGPGPKFSSGQPGGMQAGDTFQQRFDIVGEVMYVCTVHPNMKGSVKVE